MELKEFIKKVIIQINSGIKEVKNELGKEVLPDGAIICEGIPHLKDAIGQNQNTKIQ